MVNTIRGLVSRKYLTGEGEKKKRKGPVGEPHTFRGSKRVGHFLQDVAVFLHPRFGGKAREKREKEKER